MLTVAAVTLANGGDNIGVYVPVFAATGIGALITYVIVFLPLVAVWCVTGWWFAVPPGRGPSADPMGTRDPAGHIDRDRPGAAGRQRGPALPGSRRSSPEVKFLLPWGRKQHPTGSEHSSKEGAAAPHGQMTR